MAYEMVSKLLAIVNFYVVRMRSSSVAGAYTKELSSRKTLNRFAKEIRQIRVVWIDVCRPYRSAIRRKFPNARVGCDKLHVAKHPNEAVVLRESHPPGFKERGGLILAHQINGGRGITTNFSL